MPRYGSWHWVWLTSVLLTNTLLYLGSIALEIDHHQISRVKICTVLFNMLVLFLKRIPSMSFCSQPSSDLRYVLRTRGV